MYKKTNSDYLFVGLFDKSFTLDSLFTYHSRSNFPIDSKVFPAFVLFNTLQAIEKEA